MREVIGLSTLESNYLAVLCSGQDYVVDWNEHKLNKVADKTHNYEAHCTGVQNLEVFLSVGLLAFGEEVLRIAAELL